MSGTSTNWQGYPQRIYELGLKRIPRGVTVIFSLLGINMSTPRGSYGSSWLNACGGSTGASPRTT